VERTLQILVVGEDATLRAEFEAALEGIPNLRPVTHFATNYRRALELALSRRPDLVCIEMDRRPQHLVAFAEEMLGLVPESALAVLYLADQISAPEPDSAFVLQLLRANVRDFLRRPLSPAELRSLLERLFGRRPTTGVALGRMITFVSNKGGVGKSTLSVNAACELARRQPGKVLLVDASLQLGVCALLLDLTPKTTLMDAVREKERLDGTLLQQLAGVHDSGLHLLAAPADAIEATEIDDAALVQVLNVARRSYEYVIVDTFPMLDSVVVSVLDLADLVFVVLQGTTPDIVGTAKFLPVLGRLGVPPGRLRVLLNRNYRNFAGNLTVADIEERIGAPIEKVFHYDKGVLIATNTGRPCVMGANRFFGFGRTMRQLVDAVERTSTAETGAQAVEPEARKLASA
jgi:pilus assembly protein CpaE